MVYTQVDGFVLVNSSDFNASILIPVFNHENAIEGTLQHALQFGYRVLLVDDGSKPSCQSKVQSLCQTHGESVMLLRLEHNSGKGAAIKQGLAKLKAEGFSHALQVDADGQHDLSDVPKFMLTAANSPRAMVTGVPIYDESVPKYRYYLRYLTHVWVWINTLSWQAKDTMCGFRVYPLSQCEMLLQQHSCGDRMEFDTEIVVHWLWLDHELINLPTQVRYPTDGVSYFKPLQDNYLISTMHARMFFGMLKRLPRILWRRYRG